MKTPQTAVSRDFRSHSPEVRYAETDAALEKAEQLPNERFHIGLGQLARSIPAAQTILQ